MEHPVVPLLWERMELHLLRTLATLCHAPLLHLDEYFSFYLFVLCPSDHADKLPVSRQVIILALNLLFGLVEMYIKQSKYIGILKVGSSFMMTAGMTDKVEQLVALTSLNG
mmetsp:Transcript_16288/g.36629  ORF Transcript_16288/g.36629 Transcript_16288/m.36629 type:complete len:111 (-) Transcript_16288:697-1029(-)